MEEKDRIKRRVIDGQRGFSLVEAIVVIIVMGIIIVSIVPFFHINVKAYVGVKAGKDIIQSARIGYRRMINELQQIVLSEDITNGSTSQIDFDIPDDGLGTITYAFSGGILTRQGHPLVGNVQSFTIRYYTADGTEKYTPFYGDTDVWRIEIEMLVGNEDTALLLRAQVSPRNVHYS
jgi:prepilin-type N-terminal cleavage/methylation domain-containing protein